MPENQVFGRAEGGVLKVIAASSLGNMVHQLVAGRKELNYIYVLRL